MVLHTPEISETPENSRLPGKEIQNFADECCLNNDSIDKKGDGVNEAAYVAKSKTTLEIFLNIMDIQKPE